MKRVIVVVLVAFVAIPSPAQEVQPAVSIQQRIEKVASAQTPGKFATELALLKEAVSDQREIVNELAIFASVADERRRFAALEILRRLDAQPIDVIQALAPHLNAENENLQSFVRSWFRQHDNAGANESPLKPVNYEDYAEYVRKIKSPPDAFVNYIFERSPERALIVFYQNHVRHGPDAVAAAAAALQAEAREFEAARQGLEPPDGPRSRPKVREPRSNQVKGVLLGVRTVENAIWLRRNGFVDKFQEALPEAQERLAELSDREEWWVRLYVVEIMRRHREFRQVAVLDKLSDDSSSCVRKAAKAAGG